MLSSKLKKKRGKHTYKKRFSTLRQTKKKGGSRSSSLKKKLRKERLTKSKKRVDGILVNIANLQNKSRANTEKMYKKILDYKKNHSRNDDIHIDGDKIVAEINGIPTFTKRATMSNVKIGDILSLISRGEPTYCIVKNITKTGVSVIKLQKKDNNTIFYYNEPKLKDSFTWSRQMHIMDNFHPVQSPIYDMGRAEHADPAYDIAAAEHADPAYDIAAAEHADPAYDIAAAEHADPAYDISAAEHADPAYDIAANNSSPDYITIDDTTTSPQYAELSPINKTKEDIINGSWLYYVYNSLNKEPKTEKEICEKMKQKFPQRMTGKTPCNTLNYILQELVKKGYAFRVEFFKNTSNKRKSYKYYINDSN